MKNTKYLFGICCLVGIAVASQQAKDGFQWPADFKEHIQRLPATTQQIGSLADAVADLHNESMRAQANTQWIQTQIDLIVKYVDENRPAVDKLNVQVQTLDKENKRIRAELAEFQKGACPLMVRTAKSQSEKDHVKEMCRPFLTN